MKKILLTSVLAMATVAVFAQGQISIGNGISATRFPIYGPQVGSEDVSVRGNGPLSAPVGSTVYTGGLLSGAAWTIQFYAGPAGATDYGQLSLITTTVFRTGTGQLPNGITATVLGSVPGVPADGIATLGVRVFDTAGGSYEGAQVARGEGLLFQSAPLGGGLTLPPNWVGQSFSLVAVPEPTSMALAGIGAASLLIFRRRK